MIRRGKKIPQAKVKQHKQQSKLFPPGPSCSGSSTQTGTLITGRTMSFRSWSLPHINLCFRAGVGSYDMGAR